jgi:3D (Asp-Asp-Asp) domain-containing protein
LDSNKKLKDELNREKAKTVSRTPSRGEPSGGKSFYVEATAYTALCNEGCTGITATGINLLKNPGSKVIAVDPNIIPLGSKVYVDGYGYAIAGDTGGGIDGYEVDLYVRNKSTAMQWGRKKVKLTILN